MPTRSVQILFSSDEFAKLEQAAAKQGLTVPLYIKGLALGENEFNRSYQDLLAKVAMLKPGTKFNIKAVFGTEWTMSKGVKLTLGKTFYTGTQDGTIKTAKATGKDSANIMWYEKL